jgi:hypothetical protein
MAVQTSGNVKPESNVYTAWLAVAVAVVAAAAALVTYKNYFDYGTLFNVMEVFR